MLRFAVVLALASLTVSGWVCAGEDTPLLCQGDTFLQKGITGKPGGRGDMPEFKLMLAPPGSDNYRTLIYFKDFPNVTFRSVRLRIQVLNMALGANPGKIEVHKVTTAWDEKTASEDCAGAGTKWKTAMGDFDPKVYGVFDLSLLPQVNAAVLVADVTDLVKEWQATPSSNCGLILTLTPGSTADLRINSKECDDKTKRAYPTLIFTDKPVLHPGDVDLNFETSTLMAGKTGQPTAVTIKALGGKPPYSFTVLGALPKGLTLDKEGKFSGTPEREGKFVIKVKLVDSAKTELIQSYPWVVEKGEAKPDGPKPPIKPNDKPPEKPVDPNVPHDDG
ncbi:MAG TPA: DNRLRE domain-containing protein [Planctomycetota bacterium]|nr:DNRLRE domain-containing protein [Planctomycetota bacterium]